MAKRNAHGAGSIRQRSDGRWEARFTYRDEFGQAKRGSVYGSTQKECRQKLIAAIKAVDDGIYRKTERVTVKKWFEEWVVTYGTSWRPMTVEDYTKKAERYIFPHIGKVYLNALTPMQVQRLVNLLSNGSEKQKPLAAKTVKNIHGILHSALKQAVLSGIIPSNPADNTRLPKMKKPDLKPLMDEDITRFLNAIQGDAYERLYIVTLFTGLRQSEVLGLQWDDIDLNTGLITVRRQLQKQRDSSYLFIDQTKNGKDRVVPAPQGVVDVLKAQKRQQAAWRLLAGECWSNERNLVFTNEIGEHLNHNTVYKHFKRLVKKIDMKETRFHDLRHSCAIMELQSGCSVKAVQEQLGHYSSSFTMDTYAAVSQTMQKDTQERMQLLFQDVTNKKAGQI